MILNTLTDNAVAATGIEGIIADIRIANPSQCLPGALATLAGRAAKFVWPTTRLTIAKPAIPVRPASALLAGPQLKLTPKEVLNNFLIGLKAGPVHGCVQILVRVGHDRTSGSDTFAWRIVGLHQGVGNSVLIPSESAGGTVLDLLEERTTRIPVTHS